MLSLNFSLIGENLIVEYLFLFCDESSSYDYFNVDATAASKTQASKTVLNPLDDWFLSNPYPDDLAYYESNLKSDVYYVKGNYYFDKKTNPCCGVIDPNLPDEDLGLKTWKL